MPRSLRPATRLLRQDWHTHPKMFGLSLLARDILQQAILHCRSGLMQRSVAMIAATSGQATPSGPSVSAQDVRAAIVDLQKRGLVVWWPQLETLWAVEACDEQRPNTSQWKAIRKIVAAQPPQVRDAFGQRYPFPQCRESGDPRPPEDVVRPQFAQAIEEPVAAAPLPPPPPTP